METAEAIHNILTIEEESLLATLIVTTEQLADKIERQLSTKLCEDYRILCKHSLSPWETLYHAYHDIVGSDDRKRLFLRAALEAISHDLHDTTHAMAEG